MTEAIQHWDEKILKWIHVDLGHPFLDQLLPWFRNPYFWSPVYLFILVWMLYNRKWNGFWFCVYLLAVFAITDFTAAKLIKPFIHRIRPCHNNLIPFSIRELVTCGSGFSFPSAHAANHFGISVFMYFSIGKEFSKLKLPLILWAVLVAFSQLYVCVHYLSDALAGAVLGILVGGTVARLYRRRAS